MLKVLIVDRREELHVSIPGLLRDCMMDFEHCYSLGDVFQRISKEKYDLVLCQFRLGSMTGLDVMKILKISQPDALFLLFLDNTERPDLVIQATRAGADHCVGKPFHQDVLKRVIFELLSKNPDFKPEEMLEDAEKLAVLNTSLQTNGEEENNLSDFDVKVQSFSDRKKEQEARAAMTELSNSSSSDPQNENDSHKPAEAEQERTQEQSKDLSKHDPESEDNEIKRELKENFAPQEPMSAQGDGKRIQIQVSKDNMKALLSLYPKMGAPATKEQIYEALDKEGVLFGVLDDEIERALDSYQNGLNKVENRLIALGKFAKAAIPERIEYEFTPVPSLDLLEQEDGRINFKEVYQIDCCEEDQLLATRIPPIPGENGIDLFGQTVEVKAPKISPVRAGVNVIETDDGKFFSTLSGHVSLRMNRIIEVSPVYIIPGDVDYNTGNIRYKGSVLVRGTIRSGFKVVAEGDVQVLGLVEAATVKAGGDITIAGGIHGSNRAKIQCGGNMTLKFASHAQLKIGRDLIVEDSLLSCNVLSFGKVKVQGNKGIVGGRCYARSGIESSFLGSELGITTELIVGKNYWVRKEISHCLEQKRLNHQNLNKISQMLQEIERISPDRIPAELQEKVTGLQDVLDNLRVRDQEFLTKHNELQKELLEKCDATVQVKSKAFADVKIQIGASFLTLFDPMERVQFISHPKRNKVMAKPIKTEIKEKSKKLPGDKKYTSKF